MLIVCPSCATTYMIDPASVGAAGRTVRCARCRATWFATVPAADLDAFVDGVIAEAKAEAHQAPVPAEAAAEAGAPPAPFPDPGAWPPADAGPPESLPPAPQLGEPVTITDAPPLVPPIEQAPLSGAASAALDARDIDNFAARRLRLQARRKKSRRSSRWTAVILLLFAFNVALVGARSEVVRYLPQTASLFALIGLPVNLRELTFDKVHIARATQDGISILEIDGEIVSAARKPVEVPRLRFAARNTAGQEIYTWTALPARSILQPGERLAFHTRLAAPPKDASDVMVRFFTARDAMAGGK